MDVPSAEPSTVSGAQGPRPSRRRLWGLRAVLIFASLLPLVWGVGSLVDAFGGGPHLVHFLIGAGVVLAALWLAPLAAMWRPERLPVALLAYLAFVVAGVTAAALSASNGVVAVVLIVQASLVVLLHPYRTAAFRRPIVLSPLLLPLALLSGAALARYAVSRAGLQAVGDEHALMAHYFDQAWFALAVALFLLLAALREDARRFAARVGGGALIAFGAVSILLPTTSSSLGLIWGSVALVAGLAAVVIAELETRRAAAGGRRTAAAR
jgi:hypothetical protein